MGISRNHETIRTAAEALTILAEIHDDPKLHKYIASVRDLCWVCLPNKYRLPKDEKAKILETAAYYKARNAVCGMEGK